MKIILQRTVHVTLIMIHVLSTSSQYKVLYLHKITISSKISTTSYKVTKYLVYVKLSIITLTKFSVFHSLWISTVCSYIVHNHSLLQSL